MTNEQCIEIAEKVWGWKQDGRIWLDQNDNILRWPDERSEHHGDFYWIERDTKELVNSWEGFGRTVEAMAERFYELAPDIDRQGYANGMIGFSRYDYIFHNLNCQGEMEKPEKIIEATHLAALEALKGEAVKDVPKKTK